jgi:transcriptional regulator with XRE-family HTH domain
MTDTVTDPAPGPARLSAVRAKAGQAGGRAALGTPKTNRGVTGFDGVQLARWRLDRDLDQKDLARRAGCSPAAVTRYEKATDEPGSRKPTKPMLMRLIAALNDGIADPARIMGITDLVDLSETARADPEMARQVAAQILAQGPPPTAPARQIAEQILAQTCVPEQTKKVSVG